MAQGLPDRAALAGLALHPAAGTLRFGPFRFDRANRVLTRDEVELPLPPRALGVLEHLLARPGSIVTKPALMDAVWPDTVVTETSLTEAMSLVRQVLGDEAQQPVYVQTVHRRGYRFVAPVTVEAAGGRSVGLVSPDPPLAAPRPRLSARAIPWAFAFAAVAVAAWSLARRPAPGHRPTRFTVALPAGDPLPLKEPVTLALSPDGRILAYTAGRGEKSQLLLRAFDRFEPTAVQGTAGAAAPFFSPDGQWVAFFSEGRLKKAPVGGGAPLEICEATYPFGASWGDGDTIVFAPSFRGGLLRVAAGGGAATPLTQLDAAGGEIAHLWPEVLPGGEAALFTVWTSGGIGQARLAAVDLRSGERLPLSEAGRAARYASTGHLVFARHDGIVAAPFDARRVRLTGPPTALLSGVAMSAQIGIPQFALSPAGTLAYIPGPAKAPPSSLAWTRPGGETGPLPTPERPYMNADLAADGRRAAVTIHEGMRSDVWLADAERGTLVRLTSEGHNVEPVWSADGRHVTYAAGGRGPVNLFSVPADGSGAPARLLQSPLSQYPNSWSRDGSLLVFTELHPDTGADLWALDRGGTRPRPLLRTRFDEDLGMLSPDGRWLAYESNESNRWEVYVRPFPAMGPRWPVSTGGGYAPLWSRDGRTIYYQTDGDTLLGVDVAEGTAFKASRARVIARDAHAAWYGVAPDGRLLAIRQPAGPSAPIHVIVGWSAELRRN